MIRQSDAEQVLLFADVCREPNPPTTRNLINSRLSELDSDPKVAGLLASQPKQVSQALPERERGAFGYYLVEGLKRPASVKNGLVAADLGPLYQYVHANVHRATARKQSPYLFGERSLTRGRQTWRGRAVAAYLPPRRQLHALERAGSDSASVSAVSYYPKSRRHSFWRLGLLGLLAQSAPPTPRQAFDRAIADGRLLGPRGAWEIYERNPASGFEVGDLNRLAIALEEQAQNVIARYGEGDQFPDDPQRPGKQQFADAAELFRLCTRVRQRWPDGLDEELRPSLRAREDFCRAKAMTFDSEFDAAAALLRRSLAANPNLPEPHNALGVVNLERGRHESAISQFEASLELAPDWAYARHNLALAHVERGDYAQAEQEYRTAIERTPYHPYLFYNLGVLLQRLNRKSEAEREYRRSLESYEELDEREAAKLAEWSEQGLAAEADRARTRRSVWKNNKAEVRNALGALFHARGKLGRAADEYRAAVDLRPAFGHAKYNLGLLEAEQARGDLDHPGFSRAIALWREVLELSPDHTAARLRLAESLALLGETGEATSQYEAILEALGQFRPARAGLLELRGDAQKREGRIDRACDAYSGALELAAGEQSEKRLSRKHKALCN